MGPLTHGNWGSARKGNERASAEMLAGLPAQKRESASGKVRGRTVWGGVRGAVFGPTAEPRQDKAADARAAAGNRAHRLQPTYQAVSPPRPESTADASPRFGSNCPGSCEGIGLSVC
jgi:hypothetical protein